MNYKKKLQANLEKWGLEIYQLKRFAENEDSETQNAYSKVIEILRMKEMYARGQLENYRQDPKYSWSAVKSNAGKIRNYMASTFRKTKKAFNEGLNEKNKNK